MRRRSEIGRVRGNAPPTSDTSTGSGPLSHTLHGRITYSDGGDSQQLDSVLGDRHRAYRSAALGCVLVDRESRQHATHTFSHTRSVDEQDWLGHEISSFLTSIQRG